MQRTVPITARAGRRADRLGLLLGLIGVTVFAVTLPATRIAVLELPPVFVTFGRIALAGLAAIPTLLVMRAPWPRRAQLPLLALVVLGVVLGFPLLMALAMRTTDASHGGVVLAVLPLLTAMAAIPFGGERPSAMFWLCAVLGSAAVLAFALLKSSGGLTTGDVLLLLAAACAAVGYAAGAVLARAIPGLAVVGWALIVTLPVALLAAWLDRPAEPLAASRAAWAGFLYVALGSQFLGFLFWYKGLALGGIARVGQVQLLQTFLTLGFAALLLGERLDAVTAAFAVVTVALVWLGRRTRVAVDPGTTRAR